MSDSSDRTFTLVLRGPASAIFWPTESFHVRRWGTPHGSIEMLFQSRYQQIVEGKPAVPTDLWVEIRGKAPDLRAAINWFAPEFGGIVTILAFLSNASIGPIGLDIAFESTPSRKREFFQRFHPTPKLRAISSRRLIPSDVAAVCEKLKGHRFRVGVSSAIGRYSDALDHWGLGSEALAVLSLYVSLETLTEPHLRWYLEKHGKTQRELTASLIKADTPIHHREKAFRNAYRREVICKGDVECFNKARAARHELSHGVEDIFALRERAGDAQHRLISHVRDGIFDVLDLPDDFRTLYTSEPYNNPRGQISLEKYIWADLNTETDELAADGQMYPYFTWSSKITNVEISDDGRFEFSPTDTFSPRLGTGVTASNISLEYWDASLAPKRDVPVSDGPVSTTTKV